jgi:hypothetical protein
VFRDIIQHGMFRERLGVVSAAADAGLFAAGCVGRHREEKEREEKEGQVKLDAFFITLFLFVVLVSPPS